MKVAELIKELQKHPDADLENYIIMFRFSRDEWIQTHTLSLAMFPEKDNEIEYEEVLS